MGDVTVDALRGVDLALAGGELVVLLGPSGSGKSTLLNILGGLDVPTTGLVFYRGTDLTTASDKVLTHYRRESVGFVFQCFNLVPTLTARENVALVTDLSVRPFRSVQALDQGFPYRQQRHTREDWARRTRPQWYTSGRSDPYGTGLGSPRSGAPGRGRPALRKSCGPPM